MSRERIAIDAWATHITPEGARRWPSEFLHIFNKYDSPAVMTKGQSIEELLKEMDEAGVDKLILSAFHYRGEWVLSNEEVAAYVSQYPDRFIGAGAVNVMQKPMEVAAQVEYMAKELNMCCVRLEPYMCGDGMTGLPPNDKHFWPVYMKCSELGIAMAVQVGHNDEGAPALHRIFLKTLLRDFDKSILNIIGQQLIVRPLLVDLLWFAVLHDDRFHESDVNILVLQQRVAELGIYPHHLGIGQPQFELFRGVL